MPSETPELLLHKKDPATDGEQNFNIKTMMNDNWDKLDARALLERAHRVSKSNPHGTTAEQVGAYTKSEVDTLTQTRADAAKTSAIDFAKSFGLGSTAKRVDNIDVNIINEIGFYYVTGGTNRPGNANGFLINNKLSDQHQLQLYVPTSTGELYSRVKYNGTWGNWSQLETTAGAQAKATAAETAAKEYTKAHEDNKNNPHATNKEQVGLGNVPNYSAATQAEAEAGAKNDKLMTPQRTKQAIEKFAQTPPITANTGGTKIAPTSPNDDILVELPKLGNGLHTFYCHQDVKNSPGVTVRGFYHQTSIGFGWVYAHSFDNRIFVNYVNDNVWRGWRELSSVDDLLREVSKTQMSKITADNGNAYVRYNNVNLLDELVKTTTPNFMTFYASGNDVTGLPTPHSVRGTKVFSENTYGYVIVVNYYNEMFVNYYAGTYWTGWTKIGGGSVYVEATTHVNRNLTTGANNKLTYNNELIDNRGCYNPSLSRFTAPYDGLYFVEISAYFYAATSYQNFELKIWRNGEDYLNIDAKRWKPHQADTTVAFEQIASGCSIVPLKAGDYIEAYVYVGNTSFNGFRFDHSTFRFNHFRIIELGGQYYG
ncbi:hypothetical protein [Cytobacillus kochii]|uniref:hypothetical protein n=1 Tax=Cytobacillus kochii TaxID=859143 RepID=UPI00402AFF5B